MKKQPLYSYLLLLESGELTGQEYFAPLHCVCSMMYNFISMVCDEIIDLFDYTYEFKLYNEIF